MIKTYTLCAALILTASHVEAASKDWGNHSVWDDGLAEVAVYDAKRTVYGKPRSFQTVLITVKEDLNAAYHAKADPPYEDKRLLPILKLNRVSEIQTDNYPYRYLTSVFVDRNDVGRLVKMTMGSQEWCGNTFKELRTWQGRHEMAFHSYWDGEGDGVYPVDWDADTMLEDQLALSLRALPFSDGYHRKVKVVPSQISNRARRPAAAPATIRVVGREEMMVGDASVTGWRVDVEFGDTRQSYWFQTSGRNILLRFESSDGRSLHLAHWSRRTYW